jgi:uncharacterized HAD superfamily protein
VNRKVRSKVVGLDLDGVLYDWHSIAYDFACHYMGAKADYDTFWLRELPSWSVTAQENLTGNIDLYNKKPADKDVVEAVQELDIDYDVIYITKRPPQALGITYRWLDKSNLPNANYLYLTYNKPTVLRAQAVDYYVDDYPKRELFKLTNLILVEKVWNKDIRDLAFSVVKSIAEVPQRLRDYEEMV